MRSAIGNYAAPTTNAVLVLTLMVGCSAAQLPFEGAAHLKLLGVTRTAGLSAADFDGDGRVDLALLSGANGQLTILLNGAAGVRSGMEIDAGTSASGCDIGDFNEDGKIDLAVCHHDTDEVWLFFGTGTGGLQSPKKVHVAANKPHLHMLLAADANRDKHTDLLLAQSDDNRVWVLLGDGKGGFTPSLGSPVPTGNHPYVVAAADFDGDGNLDFATPNWYGKSVSVFLGDGEGRYTEAPTSPMVSGFAAPTALAAGDLTGDGIVDLAVGNDDSSKVQILVGDGKGGFAVGAVPDLQAQAHCFSPTLVDLTGDGKLDVVANAQNGAETFSYWINLGGGRFSFSHALPCAPDANRICVADLNGDKVPDLAVGTWDEAKTHIWFGNRP